jgi:hypothetical protein
LQQAADADALHATHSSPGSFDLRSHRAQGGSGGHDVPRFQQAGCASRRRQSAQDQRAMADRLVAGHRHRPVSGPCGAKRAGCLVECMCAGTAWPLSCEVDARRSPGAALLTAAVPYGKARGDRGQGGLIPPVRGLHHSQGP